LRRVEEVVTSRNDRRIDRPLLANDRRPDGWCPAYMIMLVSMVMPVAAAI
jgi:hypothetical protein